MAHDPDGGSKVRHTPDGPAASMTPGSPEHLALLAQRKRTEGTHNGRTWSVTGPVDTDPNHYYPKVDCHIWGAFAGLAIELGGYGDLEAVDPYSGRRFWLGNAFTPDAELGDRRDPITFGQTARTVEGGLTFFDAMRRLIDAMEAAAFESEDSTPAEAASR